MNILFFAGGLGFFLFGMYTLEAALSSLCDDKLQIKAARFCSTPLRGAVTGCLLTAAVQSSSTVTVMLVGLVDAGVIELSQSTGIIIGSNIGTSSTAWIIALSGKGFSPAALYPVFILAGSLIIILFKNNKTKTIGALSAGFALILSGMESMSAAVLPLVDSTIFSTINNPLAGFAAGLMITAVIQSSSASVGILQAVASTGVLSFEMAIPIVLGQNIGTCVTAAISAIGCGRKAKLVALIHLMFNAAGVVICGGIYFLFRIILDLNIAAHPMDVAAIHTGFNLISGAAFLILILNKNLYHLLR